MSAAEPLKSFAEIREAARLAESRLPEPTPATARKAARIEASAGEWHKRGEERTPAA
jgi:hypothetical protein